MNNIRDVIKTTFVSFRPDLLYRNPILLVTEISMFVSIVAVIFNGFFQLPFTTDYRMFYLSVILLLFLTLLFANLGYAISEGQSKSIVDSLQKFRKEAMANLIVGEETVPVSSSTLKKGDIVLVRKGEDIPMDGEVIEGNAYVSEANITGESRPVLKVLGDSVTGSTRLLTDTIKVRVTSDPGETFIDKMIGLVKKSSRERTPNEIALTVLLSGFTLIFLMVVSVLYTESAYIGLTPNVEFLIVLFICLIPTTIGSLLTAIGIASVNRMSSFNVMAKSGRAVESAGDIDTIILDKTGTITMGDREAKEFYPAAGVDKADFIRYCLACSQKDQTREGISIVKACRRVLGDNIPDEFQDYEFIPFSAVSKFSGIHKGDRYVMKGSLRAMENKYGIKDLSIEGICKEISSRGGTAIPVAVEGKFVGVIEMTDMLKPGIRERLELLRKMQIKTIMCTGDDEVTAKQISYEAGIDEYVANSTPEDKYNVVLNEKGKSRMVAMVGDGTNDAPALAKADVGLAMNSGTAAAKDASNMIDLDNDPTKLIDIIFIGKQILITRGALTTFSFANDLSKYFVILPAVFSSFGFLGFLNLLDLTNPLLAITSALIFNTFIIIFLVPMALKGVRFKPSSVSELLKRNIYLYGVGGIILPFIAIKAIYVALASFGVVW